ncbi:phage major capsid protein, HK97 family [Pedococcus dokdonensis]|uniref:Phage major capsid protein, HK97 family n=1 Tax=Pedococcus dokdonensis TaxID=443156 RepID=A0A1H0N3V1_9MICO|nr:phage major capsid protein [Pedococcus dokdonensis]SDO87050.1 phage major capsid protein, HK97 family [Pedococcus dokdonensis]
MPISTTSFSGNAFPTEVFAPILNRGLSGARFFDSLTRRDISGNSATFPTVDPTGFDWVAELGVIPEVTPGDSSSVVAPAKMAGNILLSNESLADNTFDLAAGIGDAIKGSMGPAVDAGCLYGGASPEEPDGVYDALANVTGVTLRAAVITAAAEIMGSGGDPNTVFVTPAMWAEEMARETASGPVNTGADLTIAGLRAVVVPSLAAGNGIVADTTRCYGVVRQDFRAELNAQSDQAWSRDGAQLRVIARLAAVVPAPVSAARSLTVNAA